MGTRVGWVGGSYIIHEFIGIISDVGLEMAKNGDKIINMSENFIFWVQFEPKIPKRGLLFIGSSFGL